MIMGRAAQQAIRKHLFAINSRPNKLGGKKTGYYRRAANRCRVESGPDGSASVVIDLEGFATRYTGEPKVIRPVKAKSLAIPIHPRAYGRSPREFSDLAFVPILRGRTIGLLVERKASGRGKKATIREEALFRLVTSVRTTADPTLLPTASELEAEGMRLLEQAYNPVLF
jgi:hypothetical protein